MGGPNLKFTCQEKVAIQNRFLKKQQKNPDQRELTQTWEDHANSAQQRPWSLNKAKTMCCFKLYLCFKMEFYFYELMYVLYELLDWIPAPNTLLGNSIHFYTRYI